MALLKDIPITGSTALIVGYHIIEQVLWNKGEPVQINIASWANEADRRLLHPVALSRFPTLTIAATPEPPTLTDVYDLVKSLPAWAGAKDA